MLRPNIDIERLKTMSLAERMALREQLNAECDLRDAQVIRTTSRTLADTALIVFSKGSR